MREGDTMKLLIFGIDAADPKILFHYLDEFPTISKLAREGSYGKLQGYSFGYGSYDNWATIFTGLPPREHGVIRKSGNSPECPTIDDIEPHDPLWHVLNRNGVTTAFVRGMMMNPPPEMDGWAMGGDPEFLDKTASTRYPVFCDKDAHLADLITGEFEKPFRAPYLEKLGGDWDEARADPTAIGRVMHADYFAPFLEYVQAEADYYVEATLRLQREQPTELLFFFLTLLQFFDIDCDRPGEVIPVFRDAEKNVPEKTPEPEFRRIAVVQTMEVNKTIATLNELWIRYRGAHITVVGRERFRNPFLYDPRVDDFLELEGRCVEWESFRPDRAGELRKRLKGFDLVVVPLRDGEKITELWL